MASLKSAKMALFQSAVNIQADSGVPLVIPGLNEEASGVAEDLGFDDEGPRE